MLSCARFSARFLTITLTAALLIGSALSSPARADEETLIDDAFMERATTSGDIVPRDVIENSSTGRYGADGMTDQSAAAIDAQTDAKVDAAIEVIENSDSPAATADIGVDTRSTIATPSYPHEAGIARSGTITGQGTLRGGGSISGNAPAGGDLGGGLTSSGGVQTSTTGTETSSTRTQNREGSAATGSLSGTDTGTGGRPRSSGGSTGGSLGGGSATGSSGGGGGF
ncbi:MAG: hypothetical protein KKA05_04675 [Alphaproteobacteria bacterium]|nr:hypothetical protein [Alphaproteobacteria bacterium]